MMRYARYIAVTMGLASSMAVAQMDIRYVQGLAGVLDASEAWEIEDVDDGSKAQADIDKMIYGGAAAQLSHLDGPFQYGLETGGLISFHNDTSGFVRVDGGATAGIKVENNLWLIDISLGGFASYRFGQHFRVYASAGPSIVYGSLDVDEDDVTIQPLNGGGSNANITYTPGGRESDVTVGLYARAGFEFIFDTGVTIGASARQVDSELDFGSSGTIELNDTQYFITVGKRY